MNNQILPETGFVRLPEVLKSLSRKQIHMVGGSEDLCFPRPVKLDKKLRRGAWRTSVP